VILPVILLLVFSFAQAAVAGTSVKQWVLFKDKGLSPTELTSNLDSLQSHWPSKSLLRRIKAGSSLTEQDLPVAARYIQAVAGAGCKVCGESRWLNGVAVEANTEAIEQVRHLSFVALTRPVATVRRQSLPAEEDCEEFTPSEPSPSVPLGAYGPSWRQSELAGVITAHNHGLSGRGVLIGMLDSGFQLDHRALAGLDLVGQYDFIFNDPDPSWDPKTDPKGQASHGSACLSVIAGYDPGILVGIAPEASFALGKTEFTGSETRVEEDWWVEGIEWLEMLGADVVSSSLTYRDWYKASDLDGETPLVSRAAERASELGMIVCISAGNEGPKPVTIGAPADAPMVLAIAAADSNGAITRFSSRGPSADGRIKPDLAAMGRKVVCISPLTYDRYARWNGTSLACPIVAGVAALVIQAHPDWSPDKVREALRQTADRAYMPDDSAGYGLVDCAAAIAYPALKGRVISLAGKSLPERLLIGATGDSTTVSIPVAADGFFQFDNLAGGDYSLSLFAGDSLLEMKKSLRLPPSLSTTFTLP
jgi:subtilisin family serine protease